MDQSRTITLDGVTYSVDQFSDAVKQAIGVYNAFAADLQKEQLKVLKTQSAMQALGSQIAAAVKKELADKQEPQVTASQGELKVEM